MAGRGPAPKEQHQRERDTKRRQSDAITVTADGRVRGPRLTGTHLPETVAWYDAWRRAAQAQAFLSTDWQRLLMLVPLVDAYFAKPTPLALAEIRLNEANLGATVLDRLRAKMRVVQPEEKETPAGVASIAAQRRKSAEDRLRGA